MTRLDFKGRVAVVTGGGRGIGRSHALMLASRGARVVVNDLPSNNGELNAADQVVREIKAAGGRAIASHHSVVTGADAIVRDAIDAYGQLDILINNAGAILHGMFVDVPMADLEAFFDLHFLGTSRPIRAAWPYLVQSGAGRIISTASSAMLGNAGSAAYGAGKGAIWSFMQAIALEGAPYGITANSIMPLAYTRIAESIADRAVVKTLTEYFQPEHVAAFVAWLAHQDTQVSNETWQVSSGRAGRMTFAAYPAVRVQESTPEMWAARADELFAGGPLTAMTSTADLVGSELVGGNPNIQHAMDSSKGGIGLRPGGDW